MAEDQGFFQSTSRAGPVMGFLSLIPAKAWEYLAVAIALAAFGGFCYVKGGEGPKAQLAAKTAQMDAFVAQTKTLGEQAQKAADSRKKADQLAKENADHENAVTAAANAATVAKLRHDLAARTSGNYLPAAPASSPNPALACFDRPNLERALGDFIAGIRGLADEGTAAAIDLNTAKTWVQSLPSP